MREAAFATLAGAASAFFYASLLMAPALGVLFFFLSAVPAYAFSWQKNLQHTGVFIAAAGAIFAFFSILGVMPHGGTLLVFSSFGLFIAIPALTLATIHHKVPMNLEQLTITLALVLLFTILLFGLALFVSGMPLHTQVYQTALSLLQTLNPPQGALSIERFATVLTNTTGFFAIVMLFIFHILGLLGGFWFLFKANIPAIQLPQPITLNFKPHVSACFLLLLFLYAFLSSEQNTQGFFFYFALFLGVTVLPTTLQGFLNGRAFIRKTLAPPLKYGVYMVLLFIIWLMPFALIGLLFLAGALDQTLKALKKQ